MNKILITGGSGLVGSRFVELSNKKSEIDAPTSQELDLLDSTSSSEYINSSKPDFIVNFAAFTNVDQAENELNQENGLVYKLNSLVPKTLGMICASQGIHLIQISTDYVFDGKKEDASYKEEDETGAVNWYGQTKLFGEEFVQKSGCKYTIVRIEMPYRANFDKKNDFARFFLDTLKNGQEIKAVSDQKITPTFVDEIIDSLQTIIEMDPEGIYQIASTDAISPFDFALILAEEFNLDKSLVKSTKFEDFNLNRSAKRPKNSWLKVDNFQKLTEGKILKSNRESIKELKRQIDSEDRN